MSEPLETSYFNWLCSKVCDMQNPHHPDLLYTNFRLLRLLHEYEFVWSVIGDDSRAEDGTDLRLEYLNETNSSDAHRIFSGGCTVLEMLIALSRRAEFVTTRIDAAQWFWQMLINLGEVAGMNIMNPDPDQLREVIEQFVFRTYDDHGFGGLFPMLNTQNDQRGIELWYQLSEYLLENRIG